MGRKTKALSIILTLIMLFSMLQGGTSVLAYEKPINIPSVNFVKAPVLEYEAGDIVSFDLHSPNYGGRVQYRVVLWDNNKKTSIELWTSVDRYYKKWMPYGNNIFNLHWRIDEPGSYRITVYVKRAGLPNYITYLKGYNCDSYIESKAFVVKAKISNFSKAGQTYGASDKSKPENFSRDVNVTGENVTFKNAVVEGNLNITGNNAIIENVQVKGKILLDPGKDGNCSLNNVITKSVEILSGGKNSIHIRNSRIDGMNVNSETPIRIEVDGDTQILETTANGYIIFDRKSGSFGVITITKDEKGEAVVEFKGKIEDKVIAETSVTIKTDITSSISNLIINTENSTDVIKLEGNYGNVEINSKVKLEVANSTTLIKLVAKEDVYVALDKSANILKVERNGKDVKIVRKSENPVPIPAPNPTPIPIPTPTPTPNPDPNIDPPDIKPTVILVDSIGIMGEGNVSEITLDGGSLKMVASVLPVNATNSKVVWSVINKTGVATIGNDGILRAVSDGNVVVRATAMDSSGKYVEKEISISGQLTPNLSSASEIVSGDVDPSLVITLSNDSFLPTGVSDKLENWEINLGTTELLIKEIKRDSDTQVTVFCTGVAKVGTINIKAKANTLIKAKESNNLLFGISNVVKDIIIQGSPNKVNYIEGESLDLAGLILRLMKSDSSYVDVPYADFTNNGITTLPLNGATLKTTDLKVAISKQGITTSQAITVAHVDPKVTSISINTPTLNIPKGGNGQIIAVVNTIGGAKEDVEWRSNDTNGKVTVDYKGLVSVAEDAELGNYKITVTSKVDSNIFNEATVIVVPPKMSGNINIIGDPRYGTLLTLTEDVQNCGNQTYAWYRNNEPISANGPAYQLVKEDIGKVIRVVVEADGITGTGSLSAETPIIKKSLPPNPPTDIKCVGTAATSITLETNNTLQYSRDNGANWQDSPVFTKLNPDIVYKFMARFRETDTNEASSPSQELSIKTYAAVNATASTITDKIGNSIITLNKAVTSISDLGIEVYKDGAKLNTGDYSVTLSEGTKLEIKFAASAMLERISTIKVHITWDKHVINGGEPIAIPNSIPVLATGINIKTPNATNVVVKDTTLQLTTEVLPADADNKAIVWSIDPVSTVAEVDSKGLLTAKSVGEVNVKAYNSASGITGEIVIRVVELAPILNELLLDKGSDVNTLEVKKIAHPNALTYKYKLQDKELSEVIFMGMDMPNGFIPVGNEEITASVGQHLIVIALNDKNKVVAQREVTLTPNEVRTIPIKLYMADYRNNNIIMKEVSTVPPQILVPNVEINKDSGPKAITVSGGLIYWAEEDSHKIRCSDINGFSIRDVISTDSSETTAISVDKAGGKIYWADYTNNKLCSARLDGTQKVDVILNTDLPNGTNSGGPIAMVISGDRIYWAGDNSGTIESAKLDGTDRKIVINTGAGVQGVTAIAVDETSGKIYWSDYHNNSIKFTDLVSPGSVNYVVVNADTSPYGPLSITVKDGRIFWVCDSNGEVKRADLKGLNRASIYIPSGPTFISGIYVE